MLQAASTKDPIDQENFWKFYEQELSEMAKDFSEKAKAISENLQQTKVIYKVPSDVVKVFEKFVQDFLQDYHHMKRFELYQPVISIFENVTYSDYYRREGGESLDLDDKFKKLMLQYYGSLLEDYKENFKNFILEKFLIKMENLELPVTKVNLLEYQKIIKKCDDLKCLLRNFNEILENLPTNREQKIKEFIADFKKVNILVSIRDINTFKTFLKDPKLSELNSNVKEDFTKLIRNFIFHFETSNDILNFVNSDFVYKFQYYLITFVPVNDFNFIADTYANHTEAILKSKFTLESRYYNYRILRKFNFSKIYKSDMPQEILPLMQHVDKELRSARREDNTYYG